MNCSYCGHGLSAGARFCMHCGKETGATSAQLHAQDETKHALDAAPPVPPSGGAGGQSFMQPRSSQYHSQPEPVIAADSARRAADAVDERTGLSRDDYDFAAVGAAKADYYLPYFQAFDAAGKTSASWHWPAFFSSFFWFVYRNMWLHAIVYALFPWLAFGLAGMIAAVAGKTIGGLMFGVATLAVLGVAFVWVPMQANAWYYRHCRKQIAAVQQMHIKPQRQLQRLAGNNGSAGMVAVLLLAGAFVMLPVLGIVAALILPAYQDYIVKSQMAPVQVDVLRAQTSVANYYLEHDSVPSDLAAAGFTLSAPVQNMADAAVNPNDGTITFTFKQPALIAGKTLVTTPQMDEQHNIVWHCGSEELADKYLPPSCRSDEAAQ